MLNSLVIFANNNRKLVTAGVTGTILATGWVQVFTDGPWYVPVVTVLVLCLLAWLAQNVRRGFKMALALLVLAMTVSLNYMMALYVTGNPLTAVLWFFAPVIGFAVSMVIATVFPRQRSAWTATIVGTLTGWLASYIAFMLTVNTSISAMVSFLGTLAGFALAYFIKSGFSVKDSPTIATSEDVTEALLHEANARNWFLADQTATKGRYMVWNDRLYHLVPVMLDTEFQSLGTKKKVIGHKHVSANAWFNWLLNRTASFTAPGMVVLLDLRNTNGTKARTIFVPQVDSKREIPVGVLPARALTGKMLSTSTVLADLEKSFSKWAPELTGKQKAKLVAQADRN